MYKFIILLLLTCSLTVQKVPYQDLIAFIYKVNGNGEWVDQKLEKLPAFENGEDDVRRFLGKNMRYPAVAVRHNVSGVVHITAEVTEDGQLINEQITKDLGAGLGKEALRVVKLIPDEWTPGVLNGEPVRVQVTIPVVYRIR